MTTTLFTRYQKFVIGALAFLQFTLVLDFMILSPLGAILLDVLDITTGQFGLVVSVYAFSAGISGILAAGFADRFDRKRMLLFFYGGFLLGTLLCGIAPTYNFLLLARMVTGLFGGVIGSISFAIIADLFPLQVRGRVMGVVSTSFSAAQVLGIPIGLFLATHLGWHAPFLMIVAVGVPVGAVLAVKLQPVDAHLAAPQQRSAVQHLLKTVSQGRYLVGFSATILLATGGFMLMPFGSAFAVNNLGIPLETLPVLYIVTGVASMVAGPLLGRVADGWGPYRLFCAGSSLGVLVVVFYCSLGVTPLWEVLIFNVVLFIAVNARMVSANALTSAVPDLADRGAYMAVNASLQQLAGGVAASIAGLIVVQNGSGPLGRYDVLGYVVASAMMLTMALMYPIHVMVKRKQAQAAPPPAAVLAKA